MKRNGIEEQYVIDDFTSKDTWRIFRIMAEFVEGFEMLAKIPPAIAMFGSARALPGSFAYERAQAIAATLGRSGYSVITGGGPGVMEAANKGAAEAGAVSVGTEAEYLCEQASEFPIFLRTESHVREVLYRIRDFARRVRHAGRIVRSHHADPNTQDQAIPSDSRRKRLLERFARLGRRCVAARENDRRRRSRHHQNSRHSGRSLTLGPGFSSQGRCA